MAGYGQGLYGQGLYSPTAAISALVQDVWPPRVLVTVTGLAIGSTVTLYRSVGGNRTAVRGASEVVMTDPSLVRIDAELPFGVPVTYIVSVNDGGVEVSATPITAVLEGGVALTDAVSGNAAEVQVIAWPEKQRGRQSSVFQIGGRNVVVAGPRGGFTSQIELFTETTSAAGSLEDLLENATGGTIQFRQSGGYDRFDSYVSVLSDSETRFSADGSDPRRRWVLDVAEVDPWSAALEARGYTLQDIANTYIGLTLNDIADDYTTLLELAQGDFS